MLIRFIIFIFAFSISLAFYGQDNTGCNISELGNISFKINSTKLNAVARKKLDSLAVIILKQKGCTVAITGYSADLCENCGERSWDRCQEIISFLLKKGIPKDRLVTTNYLDGNFDFVTLKLIPGSNLEEISHPGIKNNYP